MDLLTSLIMVLGFVLVICLGVVKMTWDLSQLSVHDSPVIPETPVQFMAVLLVAVGFHLRLGIRTIGDLLERRFAEFANVPCLNPLNRKQWEELWETEAEP